MSKDQYQGLGLSEEELAALEGEEDEKLDNIDDLDSDDSDSDSDDDGDDDLDTGDDDQPTKPDAKEPAPAEQADAPVENEVEQPEFEPKVEPVADYETKISELVAKEDELAEQFDMGEITQREYRQQIRDLDSQRRALEDQQRDFEKSQEIAAQKWSWEVDTFMEAMAEQGMDYKNNKLLNAALDTAVKDLANKPENNDKPSRWFLNEAHKQVSELLGKPVKAPTTDPVKKAVSDRKPDMTKVPQTLADAPQAQNEVAGTDEFSKLDQLSGMDLERALAALPESKARAYLER